MTLEVRLPHRPGLAMLMSVLLSCCRRAVHQCSAWWINLRSYISAEQLSLIASGHGLTFAYEISSGYSLILDISQNKKQNNKEAVCIGPFSTLEVS